MFEKFTSVKQVSGLGPHCPARLNLMTGELHLNMDVWPTLTDAQRRDVVSHEEGHWMLQTRDEFLADKYALLKQAGQGHSLKAAVAAMADILDPRNPEHINRAWMRLQLAEQLDRQGMPMAAYNGCGCGGNAGKCRCSHYAGDFVDYGILGICLGKKCKEKKAAKQEQKMQLKAARQEANNTAKVLLAQQGIRGGIGGALEGLGAAIGGAAGAIAPALTGGGGVAAALSGGGAGTAISGLFGDGTNQVTNTLAGQMPPAAAQALGANNNAYNYPYYDPGAAALNEEAKKKKQQTMIIIGVIAAIIVILVVVMLTRKNS